jgi:hypothetical protein
VTPNKAVLLQQQALRTRPSHWADDGNVVVITPGAGYDHDWPVQPQQAAWTCAAASAAWLIESLGISTSEADVVNRLLPNISPALGLHWGDGRDLQTLFASFGYTVGRAWVHWDDVFARADGTWPLVMGGANWYHWTGVRGRDGQELRLANPADGWKGVHQRMNRTQFEALGPFAAVWIEGVVQDVVAGWTVDQVWGIGKAIAEEFGIPARVLLGLGIAESNLRWNARRPVDPADDARYWPDVSGGVAQQTVRWSMEYAEAGYTSGVPSPAFIESVLQRYYDPRHSFRVAAPTIAHNLAKYGDALQSLNAYNLPSGNGWSPNESNYRNGLLEADRRLSSES